MDGAAASLVYVLPPAAAVLLSGVAASVFVLSRRMLGYALHLSAGVVLGVVGVELMPRALESEAWVVAGAFLSGGVVYLGVTRAAEAAGSRFSQSARFAPVAGITIGVGFDMLTDGMMIAAGQNVEGSLGLLLSAGLVLADSPEAFSTVATAKNHGLSRRTSMLIGAVFALLLVAGGPLGDLALRGRPEDIQLAVLAFTAGMLVLVVVEDMVPEAHELDRHRTEQAALLFLLGFTAFALLSLYLG